MGELAAEEPAQKQKAEKKSGVHATHLKKKRAGVENKPAVTQHIKKQPAGVQKKPAGKTRKVYNHSLTFDDVAGCKDYPPWLVESMEGFKGSMQNPEPDDFMEVFTLPRIVPIARQAGLTSIRSMDKLNGWNLLSEEVVGNALLEIFRRRPHVVMLSPPCTMFSKMQDTNWKRIEPVKLEKQCTEAAWLLDVAIWIAKYQHENGRKFILEHPAGAKGWQREEMKDLMSLAGVTQVVMDQCQFGLKSKVEEKPMMKRTTLLSNMVEATHMTANITNICLDMGRVSWDSARAWMTSSIAEGSQCPYVSHSCCVLYCGAGAVTSTHTCEPTG